MRPAQDRGPDRDGGVVLVMCRAGGCTGPLHDALDAALRRVVRAVPHSALVSSDCALGPLSCRLRGAGPMLVVAPCDERLRAVAPATRIGPLRAVDDVATVENWLVTVAHEARLDAGLLPGHLVGERLPAATAARN